MGKQASKSTTVVQGKKAFSVRCKCDTQSAMGDIKTSGSVDGQGTRAGLEGL